MKLKALKPYFTRNYLITKIDVTNDGQKITIAINDTWYVVSIDDMICPVAVQLDPCIEEIRDPVKILQFLLDNYDKVKHIPEIDKYVFYDQILSTDLTEG